MPIRSEEMSDEALIDEMRRRLTRTDITDARLVLELRSRIEHLDQAECYEVVEMIGAAGRDAMVAGEVCDAVEFLLGLAERA